MWRLQHKALKPPKRFLFWSKLLFFCSFVHVFLLCVLFFLYKSDFYSFSVNVHKKALQKNIPILFLPFQKTVKNIHKKEVVYKKVATKTTSVKKKTSIVKSKVAKKVAKKKEQPAKKTIKKNILKKAVQKKKQKKQDKIVKKTTSKKVAPKKIVTKKVVSKKKSEAHIKTKTKKQVVQQKQQAVYCGQKQMVALQMQKIIQQEATSCWKAPVGVSKNLVCKLSLLVDWSGNINNVAVEQKSGVLMYDISARTAVAHMKLPKNLWGKKFTITFAQ